MPAWSRLGGAPGGAQRSLFRTRRRCPRRRERRPAIVPIRPVQGPAAVGRAAAAPVVAVSRWRPTAGPLARTGVLRDVSTWSGVIAAAPAAFGAGLSVEAIAEARRLTCTSAGRSRSMSVTRHSLAGGVRGGAAGGRRWGGGGGERGGGWTR